MFVKLKWDGDDAAVITVSIINTEDMHRRLFLQVAVFIQGIILHPQFLFSQRESHILAGMVVAENADAHTLVSRDFTELFNIDIIQILHADRFLAGFVIRTVTYLNRDTTLT